MRKSVRVSQTGAVGSSVVVMALLATTVWALVTGPLVRAPDMPLAGGSACGQRVAQQTAAGSVNYPDAEVEPYVTVDPTNPATSSRCSSRTAGTTAAPTATSSSSRTTAARAGIWPRASRSSRSARGPRRVARLLRPHDRSLAQLLVRREDRLRDRRLVQRERSRLRRRERDPHQPLARRRRDVADAGDGAPRHVDDGAERQGDGHGRPDRAERRLRRLGPARLAEPERQPRRLQRLAGLPRPGDVLEDDRRRRDVEPGRADLRPGREEPDDRQPDRRRRPPGRRRAS